MLGARRAIATATLVLVAAEADCGRQPAPVTVTQAQTSTASGVLGKLAKAAAVLAARKINTNYDPTFMKYSKQYFGPWFDWRWFKAQAFAESRLDPHARSWVGARGLMQLMPSTYRDIVSQNPDFGPIDQPQWNIAAGIYYNRHLWDFWHLIPYDERNHFMFASYNAGRGPIIKALNVAAAKYPDTTWANIARVAPSIHPWRYTETLGYVRTIDNTYRVLTNPYVLAALADTSH